MKKTPALTFALLLAFMISAVRQVHAADQTLEGFISDSMCGNNHMRMITQLKVPGKTAAECIQVCIKQKVSYALVVGNKVYKLDAKPQMIVPFAGKHVRIEGTLKDSTITATSIQEKKTDMSHGMPM